MPTSPQVEFEVDPSCVGSVAYTLVNNRTQATAFQTTPYPALKVCFEEGGWQGMHRRRPTHVLGPQIYNVHRFITTEIIHTAVS